MTKKRGTTMELFQEQISEIVLDFPLVVEYNAGKRYDKGDIQAFFENGIMAFISTKARTTTFFKSKFIPSSDNTEEGKKEYIHFVQTLIYLHKQVDAEEFNRRYEEMDAINIALDSLVFEDYARVIPESNIQALIKKKIISNAEKEQKSDHPF